MQWLKKYHKWFGLAVGLQLVVWLVSGLFLNLVDGKSLSPNTYRGHNDSAISRKVNQEFRPLISAQQVVKRHGQGIELRLIKLLNKPYYWLYKNKALYTHFEQDIILINAYTNEVKLIDELFASKLAYASYTGPGQVVSASLLTPPLNDFLKEKNAAWQVNFADEINTSVYIEANSGRLIGHSNDNKRIEDFMLMLHFMDYFGEGSFNNMFMMIFSLITLALVISGSVWVVSLVKHKQYRLR